jgi:hypothetical protein
VSALQSIRKEHLKAPLSSLLRSLTELTQLIPSIQVGLLSKVLLVCSVFGDSNLTSERPAIDRALIESLNLIIARHDRAADVGNEVAKVFLEQAVECPLAHLASDSTFKNKLYYDLFLKSFETRILNEASFDILKVIAKLVTRQDNYTYFVANFGFEFLYNTVLKNPVFLDDVIPSKSLTMVVDSILYIAKSNDIKALLSLFFSTEVQDKIEFFANFLSDLLSLAMIHAKLEVNQELMAALASNRFYLVANLSYLDHSVHHKADS